MAKSQIVNDDYGMNKLRDYMREDHGEPRCDNRITPPAPVAPGNRPDGDAPLPPKV